MRREGRAGAAAGIILISIAGACWAQTAAIGEPPTAPGALGGPTALGDSAAAWLPPPIEEVDEPDLLEADPLRSGGSIRLERGEERVRVRRAEWSARSAIRRASVALLARDEGPLWISAISAPRGAGPRGAAGGAAGDVAGGAGALAIRGAPPLFAAALGWTRAARRPASPVVAEPSFEAPPSPSSAAILGAALSLRARAGTFWAVAGRREADRARLATAGLAVRPRPSVAFQAVAGAVRAEPDPGATAGGAPRAGLGRVASFSARADDGGRALAAELLLESGLAPTALVEATRTRGRVSLASRWRRRPGEARPVAAEWIATARGERSSGKVTWRPWTSRAEGDDGTFEAEGAWRSPGLGPARLRIGWKRGGEDPASARERYALLDLTLASERGRSLALLASRRERVAGGARGVGATLGGRCTLAARGRAAATLVIESARTAGSAAGAAWTRELTPSGQSALVTRAGSGVAVSARGWVRIGATRVRVLVRQASSGSSAKGTPIQATMWLEWSE